MIDFEMNKLFLYILFLYYIKQIISTMLPCLCSVGSLSNHDGNAKKNVALKMTSKCFKLLRDGFNSFNLSNVADQFES